MDIDEYYSSLKENAGDLYHHGILGQKWGIRRYQNKDGSLTPEGRKHYGIEENDELKDIKINYDKKYGSKEIEGSMEIDGNKVYVSFYGEKNTDDKEAIDAMKKAASAVKKNFPEVKRNVLDKLYDDEKDYIDEAIKEGWIKEGYSKKDLINDSKLWGITFYKNDYFELGFEGKDFDTYPFGDHSLDIECYLDDNQKVNTGYSSING